MTEAAWLACGSPSAMLRFLQGRASSRKLRLFSIACFRLNWDTLTDVRLRVAVELAEQCPEGRWDESRRASVEKRLLDAFETELDGEPEYLASPVTDILRLIAKGEYLDVDAMNCSGSIAHWALGGDIYTNYREFEAELEADHTAFLRDIFGNPFRSVAFSPEWRTTTAVLLAKLMYESMDFSTMPILADALQDAGCGNEDILNHCRQPGEHVRGCWVVDLVLGEP